MKNINMIIAAISMMLSVQAFASTLEQLNEMMPTYLAHNMRCGQGLSDLLKDAVALRIDCAQRKGEAFEESSKNPKNVEEVTPSFTLCLDKNSSTTVKEKYLRIFNFSFNITTKIPDIDFKKDYINWLKKALYNFHDIPDPEFLSELGECEAFLSTKVLPQFKSIPSLVPTVAILTQTSFLSLVKKREIETAILIESGIINIEDFFHTLTIDRRGKYHFFTSDCFSNNVPVWNRFLESKMTSKDPLKCMEMGSYQGRSSCWMLDNLMNNTRSRLYCLDTFEGSMEHNALETVDMFDIFKYNIFLTKKQGNCLVFKGKSSDILENMGDHRGTFDVIYIDGSHTATDVFNHALYSFPLLKVGGILIFNNYLLESFHNPLLNPKLGVDKFISLHRDEIRILHQDNQLFMEKI